MTDRKPSLVVLLTFLVFGGVLTYVVGFPVGVWLSWRLPRTKQTIERLYYPVLREAVEAPESVEMEIFWWGSLLLRTERGADVGLSYNHEGGRTTLWFPN